MVFLLLLLMLPLFSYLTKKTRENISDSFSIPPVGTWTKAQLAQAQAQPRHRGPGPLSGVGLRTINQKGQAHTGQDT